MNEGSECTVYGLWCMVKSKKIGEKRDTTKILVTANKH